MKKIIEKRMVEQEFISIFADDGTEFQTEEECKRYEDNLHFGTIEERFNMVKHEMLYDPFAEYDNYDNCFYLITYRDESEFNITHKYFEECMGRWGEVDIDCPKSFPYTAIVFVGECYVGELKNDKKKYIEDFEKLAVQLRLVK